MASRLLLVNKLVEKDDETLNKLVGGLVAVGLRAKDEGQEGEFGAGGEKGEETALAS